MVGQRFGKLIVIKFSHRKNGRIYWECVCDCGNKCVKSGHSLKAGTTKSCGCLHSEVMTQIKTIHGETHSRLYRIWSNMKSRCYNPNVSCYKRYGAKGIMVCDEWHEYINFSKWAKENGYQDDLTIERKDPHKDYCPENCEWITSSENSKRARQRKCWGRSLETGEYVEFINIKEFSKERGFSRKCIDRVLHNKNKTHKNWVFGYLD